MADKSHESSGFSTRAIHVGSDPCQWQSRAVVPPLFMSTTFLQEAPQEFSGGFEYGRLGNPSRVGLEVCLAGLELATHCVTYSSGLGTVTAVTNILKNGEHLLAGEELFGGTYKYLAEIAVDHGVTTTFIDMNDLDVVATSLKANTKMVWLESPTNPMLKVTDIRAIADIVHNYNKDIIVVVDNTFLTPYLQKPLTLGADISMYSLTKYMNGHTDVVMGAAVTNSDAINDRLRYLQFSQGIVPSPFDCFMANRGLKTLSLRMKQHNINGLAVASFLESHPSIEKVLHPGLPSHPQHELAKRQSHGHSGMVGFYIKDALLDETKVFFSSLRLVALATSLGGVESLVELPSKMTHASVPYEERIRMGITDNLVRLSVGIEDQELIIQDLDQALVKTSKVIALRCKAN